jgi:plasmid stabilization system protein ParE
VAKEGYSIRWTKGAAQDLEQIWNYIAQQSPTYADGMIGRIVRAIEGLTVFPRMGAEVLDLPNVSAELRVWVVKPYLIIYRVQAESLNVYAVVHSSRSLPEALRGRPLG